VRIHHIALRTADLSRLEAFYAGVLGLPVVRRAPGRIWLLASEDVGDPKDNAAPSEGVARPRERDAGGPKKRDVGGPKERGTLVMLEQKDEGEPQVPANYKEFLAFSIAPSKRAAWKRALETANVAIEAETEFTLYFRDPDGRRVGLSHYVLDCS
jgi:catechol 2,3-dioxygenase-like lactoylglutathione lyase family enzyme